MSLAAGQSLSFYEILGPLGVGGMGEVSVSRARARARREADPFHFVSRVRLPVLMLNGEYDFFFPKETSQRPLFELLGTPDEHKRWEVYPGGHSVPRDTLIAETLSWLDRYLGPVAGI